MRRTLAVAVGLALLAALAWLASVHTPLAAQTGRANATPARAPTATPSITPTLSPTATLTLTGTPGVLLPTPTPPAFVLLPAPSVKNQLVGDVVAAPGSLLRSAYPSVFGDRIGLAMTNLRDVTVGARDGSGIAAVGFSIYDAATGLAVHSAAAYAPPFCVFGQQGSACKTLDLRQEGAKWPGGAAAQSGHYLLVAFVQGKIADHKGTWTLPIEVRLARDGFQALDGAARIRAVQASADGWSVRVETFGFAPLARGTHLHLYGAASAQAAGAARIDPSARVIEFPANLEGMLQSDGRGVVDVQVPSSALRADDAFVCVAVAQPDHTFIPGRGACAPLPY